MKIVFLDRKTIGEDIDLTGFEALGEVVTYEMSQPEEVPDRVTSAMSATRLPRLLPSCNRPR